MLTAVHHLINISGVAWVTVVGHFCVQIIEGLRNKSNIAIKVVNNCQNLPVKGNFSNVYNI